MTVALDVRLVELPDDVLERLALRLRRQCNALEATLSEAGRKTLEAYQERLAAAEQELERRLV